MNNKKLFSTGLPIIAAILLLCGINAAGADSAAEIDRDADKALVLLYESSSAAKEISGIAKGILIFPKVVKAGLIFGGQYGKGALRVDGKTTGYYSTKAASYGLQAGVQSFGYAMFFMTGDALQYLEKSSGWEVGVGPSFVVVDEGIARSLTTTTAKDSVYVFFFGQQGLMGGLGIQGSKISKIDPDK